MVISLIVNSIMLPLNMQVIALHITTEIIISILCNKL